ncbi:hypothetical protein HanRHA438_Chr04g0185391 [Helianthus annuus]|nr:hypothetical protein HanRHA438_Chr04g0185391 [Helianthus annuus]
MPRSEQYCFRITVPARVEHSVTQTGCFFRLPVLMFENLNGDDIADVALSPPPPPPPPPHDPRESETENLGSESDSGSFCFLDLNNFDSKLNRIKLCFFFCLLYILLLLLL